MHEKEIIELLKARDQRGIEKLLLHYGPLIRYVIRPILTNPQDQEECLSGVTIKVWNKIALFDPEHGKWNSWITALARNEAFNRVRKNRGFSETQEIRDDRISQDPTPEEQILRQERQAELKRAVEVCLICHRRILRRKSAHGGTLLAISLAEYP